VYTSGKGSSAAGLTAAVVQDANSREFFLEVRPAYFVVFFPRIGNYLQIALLVLETHWR
jgi:hypothetical protein